ncbi:hypothetical protein [Motiliproteus sp. MSK22-1]|uniref:hypothetical protein n=1 Tax=Motiliproteus sp. MSK22-1 TaxID=1897630 RepID=UPI000975A85F|nr:hypothetical protein [Motiliproteus sp. MSK22-1]OMH38044.1 hypothetical protein BGP75_07105 [Motiliproteus sp. MSK22-1]
MEIPIRKSFLFFSFIVAILLLMHFFPESSSWSIHNRFNLDTEGNIPTWYSTVLLFSISILSLVIYFLRERFIRPIERWNSFWLVLSSAYCFLSLDEGARLHELIDRSTSIKWVYVYAPFAAVFFSICFMYFWVVRRDSEDLRVWFLGGLVVYATGGLLSEFVSHYFAPLPEVLQQVEFIVEEGLEMLGTIMVLMGCFKELNYLNSAEVQRC